jgi:hypothetical protein
MIVEPILKPSQPPLREQAGLRQKPLTELARASCNPLHQNIEPDPPSSAWVWPRIFPGL